MVQYISDMFRRAWRRLDSACDRFVYRTEENLGLHDPVIPEWHRMTDYIGQMDARIDALRKSGKLADAQTAIAEVKSRLTAEQRKFLSTRNFGIRTEYQTQVLYFAYMGDQMSEMQDYLAKKFPNAVLVSSYKFP